MEDVQKVAPPQPQGAKIITFVNTSEETSWVGSEIMITMDLIKLSIHAVSGLGGSVWVQKRTGNTVNAVERWVSRCPTNVTRDKTWRKE